jgi:hypothetical protein
LEKRATISNGDWRFSTITKFDWKTWTISKFRDKNLQSFHISIAGISSTFDIIPQKVANFLKKKDSRTISKIQRKNLEQV